MRRLTTRVTLAMWAALLLAGCQDPYTTDRTVARDTAAMDRRVPVRPRRPPHGVAPGVGTTARPAATARQAVTRFATTWVNWNWRTAASQQRELARLASGALASDLRSGAQTAAVDGSLARDKPGSRGIPVAVSLRRDRNGVAGIVVTREQGYTAGHANLGGPRYRVYLVRVVRAGTGWGVSRWAPQQ